MSKLSVGRLEMPAADLGLENPFPPLHPLVKVPNFRIDPSVSESDQRYFLYGFGTPLLPYHLQDGYNRVRHRRAFQTVVLENETLRATFLIELGGRLWSLWHKPTGRELLYVNPVFQPANLAIRNAWFTGGVEWNASVPGHSPFTCSPLFAAVLHGEDGCPILRMYEWERVRGVPFHMDFALPDRSAFLYVHVRLMNPHDHEIPMYWWSNIAVPETRETRVIAPAASALVYRYPKQMICADLPVHNSVDITYPRNFDQVYDHFYRISGNTRPWITALERDGRGLIQTSTRRLSGRKLFVWGMTPGGWHWQEYLSVPGEARIELQAGLTRTQKECIPMPPAATWSWTEAYGLMEADPAAVHGRDWASAQHAVVSRLTQMLTEDELEAVDARMEALAEKPPEEIIQRGSGWGALERRRRERAGQQYFCSDGIPFDDASLGEDQEPWLTLLEEGHLPERDPAEPPGKWLVQPEWRQLLEAAVQNQANAHWPAWLHLGVMRFVSGETDAARQAWERSLALKPSAWALRNLAVLDQDEGRPAEAAEQYLEALRMAPNLRPLVIECCEALLSAGRPADLLALIAQLETGLRDDGRIRLLEAKARLAAGDLAATERIFSTPFEIPDVREGEVSVSDVWFEMHERRVAKAEGIPLDDALRKRVRRELTLPIRFDFRMDAQ